jgi:replicative DNA helicase
MKRVVSFRQTPIKKNTGEQFALAAGKMPPQAVSLEEAVLGALMLNRDAVSMVIDILKPNSFYLESHGTVYQAIQNLFEKSQPVDLLTVTEELKRMGELEQAGGPYFLVELTNRVGSTANVEFHARLVAEKFLQRELIRVSTNIIRDAYEDTTDVFDLLDRAEQNLFAVAEQNLGKGVQQMGSLMTKAFKQLEELSGKKDGLTGVPSGFSALDRLTSGWQPSDLIIVAARPGMGKTSFTLAVARNAAVDYKKGVAFFSLEMSSVQLVNRLISMEAELSSETLRQGKLPKEEITLLQKRLEGLGEAPIFIDDTPGLNVFELRAKCRRLKMQHDIQLIVIDYLQLMTATTENRGSNREQEISTISRSLKALAKELNVPVIALSQLSRQVEVRGGNKKPQLSDLRESGAIEQDADIVSFIYRPEYYNILEDDEGNSVKGIAEIIVAKHRNGSTDTVQLKWDGQYARFGDLGHSGASPFSLGGSDDHFFDLSGAESQKLPSKMNNDYLKDDSEEPPF